MNTDCKKCGAQMPPIDPAPRGMFSAGRMTITAYACCACGHWNDLKRRKGYKEYYAKQISGGREE